MSKRSPLSGRMVEGSVAPIVAMSSAVPLPFLAQYLLGAGRYGEWALFATINAAGNTVDLGGMAFVAASYGARKARSALLRGVLVTCLGSLVVGIVALIAVVTLFHSRRGDLSQANLLPGLVLMTVATGFNSAVSICSMSQLAVGRMRIRNGLLIWQSVMQLTVTLVLLCVTRSPYALVFGVLISSVVVCIWCALFHRVLTPDEMKEGARLTLRGYVAAGSVSLPFSIFITQGDRWFVGATSTSRVLAMYDLSARVVSLPKFLCQSLNQSLVSDISRVKDDRQKRSDLVRHAIGLTNAIAGPAVPIGAVCAFFLLRHSHTISTDSALVIAALLAIGAGVHAATSPISAMVNGLGKPWLEARYLMIAGVVALIGWSFALSSHSLVIAASTSGSALLVGSIFFLITARKLYS